MFEINGEFWKVLSVAPSDPILLRPDGFFTVGACDNLTKTIYLSSSLSGAFKKKVLCHEITHAAMFSYNVTLNEEQEELIAELIATFGDEIVSITNALFYGIRRR